MKTLARLPIYIMVGFIIYCCLLCSAHAEQMTDAEITEANMANFVKRKIHNHEPNPQSLAEAGRDNRADNHQFVHASIEDVADADFEKRVERINGLKKGEHYEGR